MDIVSNMAAKLAWKYSSRKRTMTLVQTNTNAQTHTILQYALEKIQIKIKGCRT